MAFPKAKILVIDDEEVIRDVLSKYLTRRGYLVDTAKDGEVACAKLQRSTDYNLLITDLRMPNVDGLEVLRNTKKTNPYIEVIVLTGYYTIEYAVEAIRLGAFDFVCKPCDFEALAETVQSCLQEQKEKMSRVNLSEVQSFFEITKTINTTSTNLDSFLSKILDFALEVSSANKGCLLLKDEKEGRFVPRAFRDLEADPGLMNSLLNNEPDRWVNALDIPLRSGNEEFGLLKLAAKKRGEEFNDRERMLVSILAGQAAVCLKKANLFEELNLNNQQLKNIILKLDQTNTQLIQAEKLAALGRFSAGIAHEVKNPLGILMSGIEYLKLILADPDKEISDTLEKMKTAIARANDILMNLLKFARPSELKTQKCRPEQIIDSTLSLMELRAPLKNIRIIKEYSDAELCIEVDKGQIEQVLFNLLINAQDAMPKGGNITVKVSSETAVDIPDKGGCLIEVKDDGQGISPEDQVKIFEPFFTTKRDKKGTGLGLSLSRTIIENHNGKMTIESQPGRGTTVKILLPFSKQEVA